MRRVTIILLGAGQVGRALVTRLIEAASLHRERDGFALSIVAWCDVDGAAAEPEGLSTTELSEIAAAKAAGAPFPELPSRHKPDPVAILNTAAAPGCIIVDVTASGGTVPVLELTLQRGLGVVTANKVPLVGPQDVFDRLTGQRQFRYETTVGSAVPIIEATLGLVRAMDRVDLVRGVLSGTVGFVSSGLELQRPFSELVREAIRCGYAEPDFRLDLSGMDVARKALIIARTLGWRLELGDVEVEDLLPAGFRTLSRDECLARLHELDAAYAERAAAAAADGRVLRYVAELCNGRAAVGMRAVPADSAVGRLRGTDNLVAYHTRCYSDTPLVLQGRGAGADAAAAGVHGDIVALAGGR